MSLEPAAGELVAALSFSGVFTPFTNTVVNEVLPRKISSRPFVSFDTRLLAKERKLTVCPSELIDGT